MGFSKKVDLVSGIALVIAAIGIYLEASQLPNYGEGIGSGGYPTFVAAGLFVLGLILASSSFLQILAKSGGEEKKITGVGRVMLFLGMILAYIWLMEYIGFNISSFLFLFSGSLFFGYEKGWARAIVINGLLIAASYITFRYGFLVLLPTGRLF